MKKKTMLIIGGVAAAGVVGYLIYKHRSSSAPATPPKVLTAPPFRPPTRGAFDTSTVVKPIVQVFSGPPTNSTRPESFSTTKTIGLGNYVRSGS